MKLWNFEKYAERTAVVTEDGREFRYAELDLLRQKLALHIKSRTLTVLLADNDLGSLIGYITCLSCDSVPILLPAEKENPKIQEMITRYHPEYIWLSETMSEEVLGETEYTYQIHFSFFTYHLLVRNSWMHHPLCPELALLLPTSGSTGNPKLVRISQANILANTKSICQYLELTEHDRAVTSLPMSYTYGLSVINTLLYAGGSIFLTKRRTIQKQFWENMKRHAVTLLAGVPYTFEMMKKSRIEAWELPALRILTQAGGKLSEKLQKYWGEYALRTSKNFFVMYGQTEATARISYLPVKDCLRKIGSVGIAVPDSKIVIVDESHNFINKAGEQGEIVCVGPQVSMGYAETEEDLVKKDDNGKILLTGDLGYMDAEGYLVITGRKNRIAKLLGRRIELTELERKAEQCLGREVTALTDDRRIILFTDADVSDEMQNELMKQFSLRANIFVICARDEIPRTGNGKIDYGCSDFLSGMIDKKRNFPYNEGNVFE